MKYLPTALLLLFVAGCSLYSQGTVDNRELDTLLRNYYNVTAGENPKALSCGKLEKKVGVSVRCTATEPRGQTWPMTATVKEVHNGQTRVEAAFVDRISSLESTKDAAIDTYRKDLGSDPRAVVCKGVQRIAENATRRCTLTERNGNQWGLTHKFVTAAGDEYEITYDDDYVTPSEVATGVAGFFKQDTGITPRTTVCESLLRAKAGATIRCIVTENNNTRWGATVRVATATADAADYDITIDEGPLR